MREAGALLVPTRTIIAETFASDQLPPYAKAKMAAIADVHASAATMAQPAPDVRSVHSHAGRLK